MNVPKAVSESYIELGSHADEPTIALVLDHAGVTRAQFDEHFDDLEGVCLMALEETLWMLEGSNMPRRLDEGNMGPAAAQSICDDIVARVDAAWRPVTVGIRHHGAVVQAAFGHAIQHRAAAYFGAFPGFRKMDQAFLHTSSHYVGHGLAAIVAAWAAGEMTSDAATVSAHMARLLPGWLVDPGSIAVSGDSVL